MRVHQLALPRPFDLDEGVYWESLRAMHAGAALYREIYFSQPPLFLMTVFPAYTAFGQTIFAARLGVAIVSLVGLCGGYILGRAVSGRLGGFGALALLIGSAPYLVMSQTLQAEGPAIGFSLLGTGIAFRACRGPATRRSPLELTIAGVCLGVAVLSKLLAVATLIPVITLLMMKVLTSKDREEECYALYLAAAFACGFMAVVAFVALYFLRDLHNLLTQVVGYHLAAATAYHRGQATNLSRIVALLASPIGVAAALGTIAALLNKNWNLIPMLAWLVSTVLMLSNLFPLFDHHLVAVVPPLVGLSALILAPRPVRAPLTVLAKLIKIAGIMAMAAAVAVGFRAELIVYRDVAYRQIYGSNFITDRRAVRQIGEYIHGGDQVVTDAQFLAALADRDTPPWLVDTTLVRINTGQLSAKELVDDTSKASVHGVLFYGDRLARVPGYRQWVARHFRLVDRLGGNNGLWVR